MSSVFKLGFIADSDKNTLGSDVSSINYAKFYGLVRGMFNAVFLNKLALNNDYELFVGTNRLSSMVFALAFDDSLKAHGLTHNSKLFIMSHEKLYSSLIDKLVFFEVINRFNNIEEIYCHDVGYSNSLKIDKRVIYQADAVFCLYDSNKLSHYSTTLKIAEDNTQHLTRLSIASIKFFNKSDTIMQFCNFISDLQERINNGSFEYTPELSLQNQT